MQRVIAYIDGFNLYFGLKSKGWRRYYWLNQQILVQNLLKPHHQLVFTKYFTARIAGPADKQKRQNTYLEALATLPDFQIYFGKYQNISRKCNRCGFEDEVPNEKMTDVNIAVELLSDAFQERYDTAFLISADSDLVPPIKRIRLLFPEKNIIIAFPPDRFSKELDKHARSTFTIGRANIAKSLFPQEVEKADGYILICPERWRPENKS
ncbi:MAG: NYN domain-containing protein [Smithellaceae bacterium]|nr:NYN domain-containing protein [Smithellaceae bacterium]